MALIKCPECGRENVSDTAISCPDCGFNVRKYIDEKKKESAAVAEEERRAIEKEKNYLEQYTAACNIQKSAKTVSEFARARDMFQKLNEYNDSRQRMEECNKEYNKLMAVQKKKGKKVFVIVCAVIAAILLIFLGFDFAGYMKGVSLYNSNEYDKALEQFDKVHVFNANSYVRIIYMEKNYQEGIENEEKGNYSKAIECFSLCGDYKDAKDRIEKAKPLQSVQEAVGKMANGNLLEARELLEALPDSVKDSNHEVSEYIELINNAIDSGWGGIWQYQATFTGDTVIFADLIIKDKELYVKFTDVYEGFESVVGTGKVSGDTAPISGQDYTPRLLSSNRMQFYGKIEFQKVKDYLEMDDYR